MRGFIAARIEPAGSIYLMAEAKRNFVNNAFLPPVDMYMEGHVDMHIY